MSLQDELLNDESIIFDEINGLAKPMRLKTLKGFVDDDSLAIFYESNIDLVMNGGMENNTSNVLIRIPRSVFNEASKNESIVRGWLILNKEEKKEWEVQSVIEKNGLSVRFACTRSHFAGAKT